MNTVHAEGQLAHHFWGDYSATIGLCFRDSACADDALRVLKGKWVKSQKRDNVLVWHGNSEELDLIKLEFAKYGADVSVIDSVAHSVDYGDMFELDIPVIPIEQLNLF